MKILFSGGGTLGPVTPLLAMYEHLKDSENVEFLWVGTKEGPEEYLIKNAGIRFVAFPASKLRRYFSFQTFADIFVFIGAFFQALIFLYKERPDICISTGAYVSVPIHWAAKILHIATWIHQQDVVVGLANRLMAPFANVITVVLEQSLLKFPKHKTRLLGNPVRPSIFMGTKEAAFQKFSLDSNLPVLLAMGGGTGSEKINVLIAQVAFELDTLCQIIHVTGKERKTLEPTTPLKHYHCVEFLDTDMKDAYAVADIVVSRGGFGTLSELAALKKSAIIIPKSGQQEKNIQFCADSGGLLLCNENTVTPIELADKIRGLLEDPLLHQALGEKLFHLIPVATVDSIKDILSFLQREK